MTKSKKNNAATSRATITAKSSANPPANSLSVNKNLAQMLKGGVIMDVTNAEQARIAEQAGAVAVMALERVPSDIRAQGGVARMSDPKMIREIQAAVSIPVMAKVRIGHIAEAQILQALKIDFIDESEVLTPADTRHIEKKSFQVPFVCGATGLGEALRRIHEGAAMMRTKGEAGTGDVVEAVRHMRKIMAEIQALKKMSEAELKKYATAERVNIDLLKKVRRDGKLPVVNFAAGGIATPADAAFLMQIGAEGVFVGSGIFKSKDPAKRARAIVLATTYYNDPAMLAKVSENLGSPMLGMPADEVAVRLRDRGVKL
jgi:pyridoxal 5'-phosphate synthase pdxS subunit